MTRIAPGVQRLGSELVNFYAVEEDGRHTLVDAGLPAFHGQVAEAIGDLDTLDAIVLTHAHDDHIGVAERLRAETGVPVYVHVADEELARSGKQPKREASVLPYLRRPAAWQIIGHMLAKGGARTQRIKAVTTYSDGEVLDVPGHP